jgi:hypothetical protein
MKALILLITITIYTNLFSQGGWFWQNPLPQGNILKDIHIFDANTSIAVGDYGTILKTTNGGTNWTNQTSGTTNWLRPVHFVDMNTGWAVGEFGTILKTTTSGVTWIKEVQNSKIKIQNFVLRQNYPNPFNSSTRIRFSLAKSGYVTLKIYNVLGEEIETIIKGKYSEGEYEVKWDAKGLNSGVYFYRLQAGEIIVETRKLLFIK